MKSKAAVLAVLVIVAIVLGVACSSGRPDAGGSNVSGRVVDAEGKPVAGVQVTAPGCRPVLTDANGDFRLTRVAPNPRLAVSFTAPGFMNATYVIQQQARMGKNAIVIWPRAAAVTLDAATGGRVPLGSGGSITFPRNALVDGAGRPVAGPVDVYATYLDVSDPRQLGVVPGDFTARMRNGSERRLQSFGVFEVSVADSNGRRVEIARGQRAEVRIPVPSAYRERAPERVGSYSFDAPNGYWIEEGTLVLDDLVYSGTIDRTDWSWNADDPIDTTCMTFKVVRPWQNNLPEANCWVQVTGVNYGSVSWGYTNAQGLVCLLVKRNEPVSIKAVSTANQNYQNPPFTVTSPNIASGAADCGDPQKCPTTVVELDIIVGGNLNP